MQVVGHQAELENANGGIVLAHHIELIDNRISQCGAFHSRLRRVVVGYHQRAQQRLARWYRQRNMINADTPPCRPWLLPLPLIFHVFWFLSHNRVPVAFLFLILIALVFLLLQLAETLVQSRKDKASS